MVEWFPVKAMRETMKQHMKIMEDTIAASPDTIGIVVRNSFHTGNVLVDMYVTYVRGATGRPIRQIVELRNIRRDHGLSFKEAAGLTNILFMTNRDCELVDASRGFTSFSSEHGLASAVVSG